MLHIPYASAKIKNKLWCLKRYIPLPYYFLLPPTQKPFHSPTHFLLPNVDFTGDQIPVIFHFSNLNTSSILVILVTCVFPCKSL